MFKIDLETDLDVFLKQIENWDGTQPTFQECVASALFHAVVLGYGDDFRYKFASEFEIARNSVGRYALGQFKPGVRMQKEIIKFVRTDLALRRDQIRAEHWLYLAALRSMSDFPPDELPPKDKY